MLALPTLPTGSAPTSLWHRPRSLSARNAPAPRAAATHLMEVEDLHAGPPSSASPPRTPLGGAPSITKNGSAHSPFDDRFLRALSPLHDGAWPSDELGSLGIDDLNFALGGVAPQALGGSGGSGPRLDLDLDQDQDPLCRPPPAAPAAGGAGAFAPPPSVVPATACPPHASEQERGALEPPPPGASRHVWAPGGAVGGYTIVGTSSCVLLGQSEPTLAWGVHLSDGKGMIVRAPVAPEHLAPARLVLEPTFQPVHAPVADLAKPPSHALLVGAVGTDLCTWHVGLDASLHGCSILHRASDVLREVDASDTLIAGGGHDGHINVIDATTATLLTSQNAKSVVSSVRVNHSGAAANTVSFTTEGGLFRLFDVRDRGVAQGHSFTSPRRSYYCHTIVDDFSVVLGTSGGSLVTADLRYPGVDVKSTRIEGLEAIGSIAMLPATKEWIAGGESGIAYGSYSNVGGEDGGSWLSLECRWVHRIAGTGGGGSDGAQPTESLPPMAAVSVASCMMSGGAAEEDEDEEVEATYQPVGTCVRSDGLIELYRMSY